VPKPPDDMWTPYGVAIPSTRPRRSVGRLDGFLCMSIEYLRERNARFWRTGTFVSFTQAFALDRPLPGVKTAQEGSKKM
jgi:hypothetical protein